MNPIVLAWQNENNLTPYPLARSFGYDGFLIDANFIQFDGFIPTLSKIKLTDDSIQLTLIIDSGSKVVTYTISSLTAGAQQLIYDGARYIGLLVFGAGVSKFVDAKGNQSTTNVNIPFLPHLVKSIPSSAGVFAINNLYGALEFTSDAYVNYSIDSNDITFNAIAVPPEINENYLKTLNSVGPLANSVFIKNTDIIKVTGGAAVVTLSLVGNTNNGITQTNSVIVTSDGG